jgi:hypothetical protein
MVTNLRATATWIRVIPPYGHDPCARQRDPLRDNARQLDLSESSPPTPMVPS